MGAPKQVTQQIDRTLIRSRGSDRAIKLEVEIEMIDEERIPMVLQAYTTDRTDPASFHAVFIVHGQRLRGVDFDPVGRRKGYKVRIPKGWHQNVCDPNLPSRNDMDNEHQALEDFEPSDFLDFLRRVARMWNIDLWEQEQLL